MYLTRYSVEIRNPISKIRLAIRRMSQNFLDWQLPIDWPSGLILSNLATLIGIQFELDFQFRFEFQLDLNL